MARYTLTERDLELLLSLSKYRYLSVSQIHTVHFPSRQTTYRRLRALTNLNYVQPFNVPTIPERLYHITKTGARALAAYAELPYDELPWHPPSKKPKDYYFLRHFLELNDFQIALLEACLSSEIDLLGFLPEYKGTKTPRGGLRRHVRDEAPDVTQHGRPVAHTPDAVFALEKASKPALFFLEIDRGTEVVSNPAKGFLKAVRFYLNYWHSGGYRRYEKEFGISQTRQPFRLLVVTPSEARIDTMRQATTQLPFPNSDPKRFFWATTPDKISPETLFDPIWRSLELGDDRSYRIG